MLLLSLKFYSLRPLLSLQTLQWVKPLSAAANDQVLVDSMAASSKAG